MDGGFVSRHFATRTSLKEASIRDPERPKRPLSSYLRFAREFRAKHSDAKDMRSISDGWKNLSEAEKQPFEKAFKAEIEVYNTAFKAYKASGKRDDFRRDLERPKKPMTSFFTWARQQRKAPEIAHLSMLEQSAVLGPKWAAMPTEEKAALHAESQRLLEAYRAKLDIYKQSGLEEAWLERTGRLEIIRAAEAKKQAEADSKREERLRKKARVLQHKERQRVLARGVLAREKAKAAAAKEKEKSKLRDEKMKAAKDKEKEVAKVASEKVRKAAAVKKEREKVKAALARDKAKKASDKTKAKAAADRLKAREAGEKQKMKAARDRQKVKAALEKENAKRAKEAAKGAARS